MGDYDVVVIGAGPGGYVCAIRAAQLGLKTAIVDKQWLGGVCLNVGCIPSKALLKNADVAHTLRERGKEFGFSLENLTLDYSVAVKRSRQVSDRLVKGVGFLMKKNNIDVYMGAAKVAKQDTVVVTDKDGKTSEIKTKNIVVATGASVAVPPGWADRRAKDRHLSGSDLAGKAAQVCNRHRRRGNWRRIRYHLAFLWRGSHDRRDAAADRAAGG